jgi:UDP-N-acetylmuramate: L-alanyl-gamma-D-glutamyl-meso-diaminopimelate ligase
MASLAGLLAARGDEVTGSDQDVYPPMSTQLEELGIAVRSPYAEENVPEDADLVVIGNALSRGNPEVEAVLDRRQRFCSLPELLGREFLEPRRSLVVAGTHGKTTTASMLAGILDAAGLDPSFLIGGIPRAFGRSSRLSGGEHFVVEGDEYDCSFFDKRPKFVHYRPEVAVIGNVEFDHADIYADLAAVQLAFERLLSVVPRSGLAVLGLESPALAALLPKAFSRVQTFGIGVDADWTAESLCPGEESWTFRVRERGRDLGEFRLSAGGPHNVRNALAALAVAAELGVSPDRAREALGTFPGVKRRMELRGRARGVAVFDDFAHHPTAVRETLGAARAVRSVGRLVAVFEPRSYTARTTLFQGEFAAALALADEVIVARAFRPEKVPEGRRLSEPDLVRAVEALGTPARYIAEVPDIVATLGRELEAGDRVLILSNGGFSGIHERLLAALG